MKKNFSYDSNPAENIIRGNSATTQGFEAENLGGREDKAETQEVTKITIPPIQETEQKLAWTIYAYKKQKRAIQIYAKLNDRKEHECITEAIEDFIKKYNIQY
jgi:hypothetical protein